jgi:hypothetical protein
MDDGANPAGNMPEEDFLAGEMEAATAAIRQTLDDLKRDLRSAADVRLWTRRHPWMAVATATTAGLVMGKAVTSATSHAGRRADNRPDTVAATPSQAPAPRTADFSWLRQPIASLVQTLLSALAVGTVQAITRGAGAPASRGDGPSPADAAVQAAASNGKTRTVS